MGLDDAGPSLRNASAKVNRIARPGAGDGGYGGGQGSFARRGEPYPWASDGPGDYTDEPPF